MDELRAIYEDVLAAAAASFGESKEDMVYGEGDAAADILLVGEAPGAEETRLSRPFVGKAGKNLDEFLDILDLKREDIYITNVVKFRPYKISAKGTLSNRPPSRDEFACMLPHLIREIEAVAPRIVVTLGNVPLRAVLGQKGATIGSIHAEVVNAKARSHLFTLFPLYHPASIIYNRALEPVYQEDLQKLKHYINSKSNKKET